MFNFFKRRNEQSLDDEIDFHLQAEIDQRIADGATPNEARDAARRAFGNIMQVRETTRQMWGWTLLERCLQDTRYALRALLRTPAFTLTAVLSLGLGVGANVASFSLADAFLLRPLPIDKPDDVIVLSGQTSQSSLEALSFPDFRDLRQNNRSFSDLVGHQLTRLGFAPDADAVPQMKFGTFVTGNLFVALGVQPALGRAFTEAETSVAGAEPVAILGNDFWQQQYASNPAIVNSTIRLNGVAFTVIGVAPPSFTGMDPIIRPAVFIPMSTYARVHPQAHTSIFEDRDARSLIVRGRLKPGVTTAQAQNEMTAIAKSLEREYPNTNRDRTIRVRSEFDYRVAQAPAGAVTALMLSILAAAVLLIACANIANLLLARARARSREVAIRLAIGAGRARIVQQFLTENLVLSLFGGTAGLALAYAFIRYLGAIRLPTDTPMVAATQLDHRVFLYSLLLSVISALIFGLGPALRSVRPDVASVIKSGGVLTGGRLRNLGGRLLVSVQVALSLVLIVASVTLLDAFRRMLILDPGIKTANIMMFEFDPALSSYNDGQTTIFYRQLIDRVRTLPGVRSATLTHDIPFRPNFSDQPVVPEGYDFPRNQTSVSVAVNSVEESYFNTTGTPILEGRPFNPSDTAASRRVAVVNQEFVNRYWAGKDALGRRFQVGPGSPYFEVVGVARTGKYLSLAESPQPFVYVPLSQRPQSRMMLLVETSGAPAAITGPILQVVHDLDPNQSVFNVRAFDSFYQLGVLGPALLVIQMVGSTGIIGLSLALVGLYGLIAYSVSRRTREIGIRMAIGASRSTVVRLVLNQGLSLALGGAIAGLALSIPVFRLLSSKLAGLGSLSPLTVILAPLGLLLTAICACAIPAWRASRIDPTNALRYE